MKRKQIIPISAAVIVVILFLGLLYYVNDNSGVSPPFTVVESQSMQHSDHESQIGVIDTGDMIYVKSPEKTSIVTYVDGACSDYKTFGDYGSVIVYKRTTGNPVIHRAILWMEWDSVNSKWNLESLQNYDETLWDIDGAHDTDIYPGSAHILTMKFKRDYRGETISCSIDLNTMIQESGYLTLGDHNTNFDQNGILLRQPIRPDMIKSVADTEIPWIGCLKLMINGKETAVNNYVSNSIGCLTAAFVTIILIIISLTYILDEINLKLISRKL